MITERKATLTIHGEAPAFSILAPTQGRDCLDIRTLGGRSGYFAYDSGFESTAGCKSKITFSDGERANFSITVTRSSNLPNNATFSKWLIC
jgi:citrate synthase